MSKTQLIIIGIFIAAAIFAVFVFAGYKGGTKQELVNLTLWGTFDEREIRPVINSLNDKNDGVISVQYVQKDLSTYNDQLLEALASGVGPDLWIMDQELVLKNKNKIYQISFESFPERLFIDSFINSASDLFVLGNLSPKDNKVSRFVTGLPLAVDPVVLYWNRDLFASGGIASPPQYWDEFLTNVETLTKTDAAGNVIQSGAALGEFINVKNAKDIISMLILQAGNSIVENNAIGGEISVVLGDGGLSVVNPTENSIQFFNEFSNPKKSSYSWNRILADSDDMFVNGSLAMYFGYASEIENIKIRNPHLNFDVVSIPQIRDSSSKATFGKVYSVVISKDTSNLQASFSAMSDMVGRDFAGDFAGAFGIAPARRDLLVEGSSDPIASIFYKSAIMTKAWLDPDAEKTYEVFKDMVESTATGRLRVYEAVRVAKAQLEQLLK